MASQEALGTEQASRVHAEQEAVRLQERVTQQDDGLTILESVGQELGESIALLRQELQQSEEGHVAVVAVKE